MDARKAVMAEKREAMLETKDDALMRPPTQKERKRSACLLSLISSVVVCLALTSVCVFLPSQSSHSTELAHKLAKYAVKVAPGLLMDFQVYPPVLTPTSQGLELSNGLASDHSMISSDKKKNCVVEQTIMRHHFANSYGNPFVGPYSPPDCEFNRVVFNLTVVSAGRQFDRLGVVYFGSTELWRTSTAEPTQTGIEWVYVKDMSNYLALFKEPQTLIFDLGNLINNIYTAPYNATLKAIFFTSDDTVDPADKIVTVSARNGSMGKPSAWQYPMMKARNTFKLPQNIRKAFFTISATGQIDEEFWFGNVLSSEVDTFGQGLLLGYSPFREVQLYIDGMLAGVAWPFPIIFTGGVVPGLWRPIVGIDAFDLREEEIDITPWLPLLCDGQKHSFEIKVAGINDNGRGVGHLTPHIGNYWVLTGKVFLWLDHEGSVTTGSKIVRHVPEPKIQLTSEITKTPKGQNKTLNYSVDVQRTLSITSTIKTSHGTSHESWTQSLTYSNEGDFYNHGNTQITTQHTTGTDTSATGYQRNITYPINVNETFAENPKTKAFTIDATIARGQQIIIAGVPVFPSGLQSFNPFQSAARLPLYQGSNLETFQNGSGHYFANGKNTVAKSSGILQQDMNFRGFSYDSHKKPRGRSSELYERHVVAINGTVVTNNETLNGQPYSSYSVPRSSVGDGSGEYAGGSVRKLLGHGPPRSADD